MVMELLRGEPLDKRIGRGPVAGMAEYAFGRVRIRLAAGSLLKIASDLNRQAWVPRNNRSTPRKLAIGAHPEAEHALDRSPSGVPGCQKFRKF